MSHLPWSRVARADEVIPRKARDCRPQASRSQRGGVLGTNRGTGSVGDDLEPRKVSIGSSSITSGHSCGEDDDCTSTSSSRSPSDDLPLLTCGVGREWESEPLSILWCLKSFAAPSEALEPSRQQTSATDDHDDAAHNAAYSGTSVNSRRTGSRSARRQRDRRRLTKGSQHGCRKNEPVSPDRSSGDDESVESSPERYIGKKVTTFMKKKKTNPATFNNS